MPFSINAELWADHASAERFVAVPGSGTIKIYDSQPPWPNNSGEVFFPKDGVLAKTLSLEMERGNPRSRRRLETQILHFDGINWQGYTYAWNDEQTDATLVGAKGMDRPLTVIDANAPGGKRAHRWHYPSRAECLTCHNPWNGYTLAFNARQLNKNHDYSGVVDNQLRTLQHADLITFLKRDWKAGTEKPRAAQHGTSRRSLRRNRQCFEARMPERICKSTAPTAISSAPAAPAPSTLRLSTFP